MPTDCKIVIDGQILALEVPKYVYLLHKPKNVISSVFDSKGRTTVVDLLPKNVRLYPVGRLDYDSSGLIFLTNDGDLANKLMHPRYELEKVYEVKIDALLREDEIHRLTSGIDIGDIVCSPAKVRLIRKNENKKTSVWEVIIHEGRNRQIRRMMETLGHQVLRLQRLAEGPIQLGNLRPGEYRLLKPFELKKLQRYLEGKN